VATESELPADGTIATFVPLLLKDPALGDLLKSRVIRLTIWSNPLKTIEQDSNYLDWSSTILKGQFVLENNYLIVRLNKASSLTKSFAIVLYIISYYPTKINSDLIAICFCESRLFLKNRFIFLSFLIVILNF
jgi:hypothetical protein